MPKRITSWVLFFPTPARLPNIRISLSIFPPGSCGCQFFFYQPQPNLPPRLNCPFPKLSKASPLATRQVSCMVKAVGGSGSRSAGELLSAWPARCSPGKAPVSSEEQGGPRPFLGTYQDALLASILSKNQTFPQLSGLCSCQNFMYNCSLYSHNVQLVPVEAF